MHIHRKEGIPDESVCPSSSPPPSAARRAARAHRYRRGLHCRGRGLVRAAQPFRCACRLGNFHVQRLGSIRGRKQSADRRQAQAILDDPRMVLVNHTNKMPDDHTFTTKACGSATAVNKTLQTEAADAFLAMQAAAAKDGVTIWMQSGYRSVDYQKNLYDQKTQYFRNKGLSEAEAKKQAANIVNPPGYSEHNCGLAADLNSPEHTDLTEGFENTEAFRWLSAHAVEYGFILRYPKNAEAVTEITYEPWHWRYVGPENAALIQQSGLCFEDAVAVLQKLAAGEKITG